jgi:hypothetical protein
VKTTYNYVAKASVHKGHVVTTMGPKGRTSKKWMRCEACGETFVGIARCLRKIKESASQNS